MVTPDQKIKLWRACIQLMKNMGNPHPSWVNIKRAVDEMINAEVPSIRADAARFHKLCALVQSMPANEGAFYLRRLNDGTVNVRRVCLPEIEDSTYGATLAEAIDNQPTPKG